MLNGAVMMSERESTLMVDSTLVVALDSMPASGILMTPLAPISCAPWAFTR
ncbi:hypothetical protein D3C80_2102450 [compost metagenome]